MSAAEEHAAHERRRSMLARRERIGELEEQRAQVEDQLEQLEELSVERLERALAFARVMRLPRVALDAIEAELVAARYREAEL